MKKGDWVGVLPAITTPFLENGHVDLDGVAEHVDWLLSCGCRGIVALGSLGEGATLSASEKREILEACKGAMRAGTHLIAGIAGMGTAECVDLARTAAKGGCDGLMVLPPYVYRGDWKETQAHFSAVINATELSCMLYNNPPAYGTDLSAANVAELARWGNVHAVKESSGDARRVTAIQAELGGQLDLLVGLDDMLIEGVAAGAQGWVAGLVNAFPEESVRLFDLSVAGEASAARELNGWFLPMLRFDTVPKFVQLIKLVQQEIGRGSERVRAPRLVLEGAEREAALAVIRASLASRSRTSATAGTAGARV
jgi:dihydrodipicolinate synthase/N-acetylneuraminate lyase